MNDRNSNFKTCIAYVRTRTGYFKEAPLGTAFWSDDTVKTERIAREYMTANGADLIEVWHRKDDEWDKMVLESVFISTEAKELWAREI